MEKQKITLVVPELFKRLASEPDRKEFPYLSLALSKGDLTHIQSEQDSLALLCNLFGLTAEDYQSRAAFYQYQQHNISEGWCCYASPVAIQANRDHLEIFQADGFDLSQDETNSFCAEFNDYFKEDGLTYSTSNKKDWLCCSEAALNVSNYSPLQITGKNIIDYLPSDTSDIECRRVFNETQMLLHHSATNQQRFMQNKAEINSLWLWGGGELPAAFQINYSHFMSNSHELKGFAKLGGMTVANLEKDLSSYHFNDKGDYLIHIDVSEVSTSLEFIEDTMQQLIQLIKNRSLESFSFIPDYQQRFVLSNKGLKRFWKRHRNVYNFLQ